MRRFLIRRFFFAIISTLAATAMVFALSRAGGDPLLLFATSGYGLTEEAVEAVRKELGLDKSYPVQYISWISRIVRGDFGKTLIFRDSVAKVIVDKIPESLQLGALAWFFTTFIGVPLGVLSAVKRGTMQDYFGRFVALIGQSVPVFWFGIVLIMVFAVYLDWLPAGRIGKSLWDMKYLVLPVIAMTAGGLAGYLRLTRSAMLEVLDSEYVKLARAKGVSSAELIWKHAFRNALIQPLTASTLVFAGFIEGALVVETVFSRPGIGSEAIQAVNNKDFPLLQGLVLMFILVYVIATFITDVLYAVIDPRIRYD